MAKSFYNSWFHKLMTGQLGNTGKIADTFGNFFGKVFDNIVKSAFGTGMTDASKETMDYQLSTQQILNDEEYQRKIDFYERYESPEAQVRQYKAAGLNPALMYGSGASVSASGGIGSAGSAGSADVASSLGSMLGFISTLSGIKQRRDAVDKNAALTSESNDIRRAELDVERMRVQTYGEYLKSLTTGQNYRNETFFEMFGLQKREIEANIGLKEQQQNYFVEVAQSEGVRRELMSSGIRLNDVNATAIEVQKAILVAQEKYSDQYFRAVAKVQSAQALMSGIESSIFEKTTKDRYLAAQAELRDIVIRAGMDAKIFNGTAFEKSVEGDLTKKDWTQVVSKIVGAIIAGGAVVGSSAIRAGARAVTPVSPWSGGYSPYDQNRFWTATGTRLE